MNIRATKKPLVGAFADRTGLRRFSASPIYVGFPRVLFFMVLNMCYFECLQTLGVNYLWYQIFNILIVRITMGNDFFLQFNYLF